MQDTIITVQGRVAADPEMRVGKRTSQPFASFRLATTPRRPVPGAPGTYEDGETSWFTVVAFGHLGANLLTSVKKGEPVVVHGALTVRDFTREDGSQGSSASIKAFGVGHDLSWGQTAYEKVARPSYGGEDRFEDALRTVEESESLGDPESDDYLLTERPLRAVPAEQGEQVPV